MSQAKLFPIKSLCFVAAALLMASAFMVAPAQQKSAAGASQLNLEYLNQPLVEDWSTRHVIFSNPGAVEDARLNGKEEDWQRIVTSPRYRMQWVKRYALWAGSKPAGGSNLSNLPGFEQAGGFSEGGRQRGGGTKWAGEWRERSTLHGDWSVPIGASSTTTPTGVPAEMFPAKYTFTPIGAPDCVNDYVVFPVANPVSGEANLVGVNNLYSGTCSGTVPNVLFAYAVSTGVSIQTSPSLSMDGTKVAFVESISGGSLFHVITLDKSGNAGCPTLIAPCNGTDYLHPQPPCTRFLNGTGGTICPYNSAVDTSFTLTGSVNVTRSSVFIDYKNDIAYVGDDNGAMHKITGVFKGTPAEAGSPWPVSLASGTILTGPVYDSGGSGNIYVGSSNGNLYCVTASSGSTCSLASRAIGVANSVVDGPILDSVAETVFSESTSAGVIELSQFGVSASTGFVIGSIVTTSFGDAGTDVYDGTFDNAYFTSASNTGYMYFCGNVSLSAATPALMRVGIVNGKMNSSADTPLFQLVTTGNTGPNYDCSPLTEFFNNGTDYLFVGVKNSGAPSGCNNSTCVMSFSLPTGYGTPGSGVPFPTSATAATSIPATSSGAAVNGMSGFIIDNSSGAAGASQIYFGNYFAATGVQMSQSALQ